MNKNTKYIYTNFWNEYKELINDYEENYTMVDFNEIGVQYYNEDTLSKVVIYKPLSCDSTGW